LAIIRQSLDGKSRIKRHIPPALLLVSFCLLVVASARPAAVKTLASQGGTIIMAMDVSGSMRAPDIAPDRISAARSAAKAFINERDPHFSIGIVGFSSDAFLVQAPTTDTHMLDAAIDSLQPQLTTAIGAAVITSLKAIFPPAKVDALLPGLGVEQFVSLSDKPSGKRTPPPPPPPVQPGSYQSAAIVLMTDGRNDAGPDPVEAARVAGNLGVRIFTIGFGTADRREQRVEGQDSYTILDEATLRKMAEMTKGQYFHAQSSDELTNVYNTIFKQLIASSVKRSEETEITVFFVAAAAAFCAISALLSMLWHRRIF
jgi:Ca-activated chloride channel family protein